MTWTHRFIIRNNQDIVLVEIYDLTEIGAGLAWGTPFVEDVTPERLLQAWNAGFLLECDDGSLVEQVGTSDEEDDNG